MNTRPASKRTSQTSLALGVALLITVLAYRAGGTNWAASVGAALGISVWLWSARRSYREQAAVGVAKLRVDREGQWADEERPRSSYRRIRVSNVGGLRLDEVEVTLVACEPTPAWFQPLRLQRMRGGAHPFRLAPGGEVYIDLVALPHGHSELILVPDSSVHGDVPNGIPLQPTELTVQVAAPGLAKTRFVFEVWRNASGMLEVHGGNPDAS